MILIRPNQQCRVKNSKVSSRHMWTANVQIRDQVSKMHISKLQIRGGNRILFFLLLDENICCGYSLEVPRRGASNEYPQHMFLLRNKKYIGIFRIKKAPYLLLCIYEQKGPDQ